MAQKPSTIFINPKFKNSSSIHVNPNFLQSNKIHVNPKFLSQSMPSAAGIMPSESPNAHQSNHQVFKDNPIIRNTRRTLIRAPTPISTPRSNLAPSKVLTEKVNPLRYPQPQLIKISKNKLVTAAHLMHAQQKENEIIKNKTESIIKSKKLQRKTEKNESIYKLDRRLAPNMRKKKKIVSTYSIRRVTPKKITVTDRNLLKIGRSPQGKSSVSSKNLVMVNINGVLYKSTSNKLEKTTSLTSMSSSSSEKRLIIRGENFVLDSSGTKLKLDGGNSSFKMSRIDIGGLTYKASQSGAYERDNSHQVRSHLNLAKTKSISLLARSITAKASIICPIYRRIGKCLAYANGRCNKLHDQRYVIVCPNFIKETCTDAKCLLSHNANLHKMPVCKYFLQGLCKKQRDCLYLHKKLTEDTKLCAEFIKGYCPLAEKCNLLHDFPQSAQRDKKKYSIVRHKTKKIDKKAEVEADPESVRYYIDEGESSSGNAVPKRGALGKLPSYIPL